MKTAATVARRVVVITGASRGIGAGMAEHFAACGMWLALCARHCPTIPDGASERVLSEAVDVTDAVAVDAFATRAASRFGHIDMWINNAGLLAPIGPLAGTHADDVAALLRVNIDGVFNGTRAFVRHLHARRTSEPGAEGVLINISSGAARNAYAGWSAYCASKAAVDRLTECVQLEEADNGLRAHALAPGVVDTDMQAMIRATPEQMFPMVAKFHDIKRQAGFDSPAWVASQVLAIAFDPAARPSGVVTGIPSEHG